MTVHALRPHAAIDALADLLGPLIREKEGREYGIGRKHDATGTPTTAYLHGPGGLLTFPGVDPVLFHTIMGGRSMLGMLPASPSVEMNPTYYTLTGVQADVGTEKDGLCDNAPVGGMLKACLTTSVFGRYERATRELELNRLGQVVDRADPMDLNLVGSPIAEGNPVFGAGPQSPSTPGDILNNEVARVFWERNISFWRLLAQQAWTGNPVNNTPGGGYREMTSFPTLINTGYVDAETGQTCPSLDSDVKDHNYGRIDQNCDGIVNEIGALYYHVKDIADRTGMMPVRWVLAMRPQLFFELTKCWPCSYLFDRCQATGQEQVVVMGEENVRMRDEMRAGKYLLIDGERIQVVLDDGIPEWSNTTNANVPSGCFSSDIFLIPMSVVGGRSVTFLQYFQYANPAVTDALGRMILGAVEGAFLTWPRQTNQCIVWQSKIEPRLVLRTPWLAGRLNNVVYCPLQHTRDTFPEDPYHVDGVRTSRPGPSYYNIWQSNG